MGLPKIQQPLFELTVPSTEKKVKYRPFTVKEEKILLIAQESKDIDQVILAIKQIIGNCVEDVDVDTLAMFDLEYMLINIRAKSVSNEIEFAIKDPDTDERIEMALNIEDIQIKRDPKHNKLVKINDDITLEMAYPRIDQLKSIAEVNEKDREVVLFDMMMGCINSVVQGDQIYKLKDFSEQEVEEFIGSLSSSNISDIKTFFDTMPVLRYEKKYKLKDGTEKTFVAEGTETFFI